MKKITKLFEELNGDYFKCIQYRKKLTFVLKDTSVVDRDNINDFNMDIEKLRLFAIKHNITMPIKVKGLNQFSTIIEGYKSDFLLERGYEFIKSKTYFTKYNEQRIANSSREKLIDNFRYFINQN
jgi:hypothetical protein